MEIELKNNTATALVVSEDPKDLMIADLHKQIEYWRSFAAYLADCHAATAEYDGTLKNVSQSRRSRFGQICFSAALGLSGRWFKKYHSDVNVESAMSRCEKAAEAMKLLR